MKQLVYTLMLVSLVLGSGLSSAQAGGDVELDWLDNLSFEDMRGIGLADENKDFSWYIKKAYVAQVVQKTLIKRGFDKKTATYIAAVWDMWRYHPETGQRLYPRAANDLSDDEILEFSYNIPECVKSFSTTKCRIVYDTEYGCKFSKKHQKMCQRKFDFRSKLFGIYVPDTPKPDNAPKDTGNFISWGSASCLEIGERGAGYALFSPKTAQRVTKLRFSAINKAAITSAKDRPVFPARTKRNPPRCTQLMTADEYSKKKLSQKDRDRFIKTNTGLFKVFDQQLSLYIEPLNKKSYQGTIKWIIEQYKKANRAVPARLTKAKKYLAGKQ